MQCGFRLVPSDKKGVWLLWPWLSVKHGYTSALLTFVFPLGTPG